MRRVPIVPTLVVLCAVAIMISLGMWQLRRLHEKEALIAHYRAARSQPAQIEWTSRGITADLFYRRARLNCRTVTARSSIAGENLKGEPGVAQTARCLLPDGGQALVVLGWSQEPNAGVWSGGKVSGIIAPGPRLVAVPPLAGLSANAIPDPADLPNNHLSYAVQWFLFALTAIVIYVLALRRRR